MLIVNFLKSKKILNPLCNLLILKGETVQAI